MRPVLITTSIFVRVCLVLLLLVAVSSAERLPLKNYTTTDGLARDHVWRIVPDSRGFLWFCTTEGLSRFDGYRFFNYTTDHGLPHRQVYDFLEARDGTYWVATGGGLCRFDPNGDAQPPGTAKPAKAVFSVIPRETEKALNLTDLVEDQAGNIWVATESGLYRVERPTPTTATLKRTIDELKIGIGSLLVDRRNNLWIGSASGLYCRRPNGQMEQYAESAGFPGTFIRAMTEDRDGRLWVGVETGNARPGGICQLIAEPQPGRNIVAQLYAQQDGIPALPGIYALRQSADGAMLFGLGNGLYAAAPAKQKDDRRTVRLIYPKSITSLTEDRDGNIWIGTDTIGALKLARNGFTTWQTGDGLPSQRIKSIAAMRTGEVYAIGGGVDVQLFTGQEFQPFPLSSKIQSPGWGWNQIALQDQQGEWWFATAQGLYRYPAVATLKQLSATKPKAIYTTRDGLPTNEVFRLYEDRHGDIWGSFLGEAKAVLCRWDRATGKFQSYGTADGILASAPSAFAEDRVGNLWIGFYEGGVMRYRNSHFQAFTTADGLPPGFIRFIYSDQAGRVWIASTQEGLVRVDNPDAEHPNFVRYTTAQGLSSNQTTAVVEDQQGRIYIGTGRGVDRLDLATGQIKHYTTADGLASNFINTAFADSRGDLWFGTLVGISRLTPEPDKPAPPPPVFIGNLRVAGESYLLSALGERGLTLPALPADRNHLDIDFFGVSLAVGESLRYQYKLEGADQDWSAPTEQRSVSYPRLSPGTWRFLVRAVTAEGVASAEPATVSFTILRPVWQHWWFILLGLGTLGAAIYFVQRYRVRRLLELERVRTRIATDLHDDIGASLSRMAILSEVVKQQNGHNEQSAHLLTDIADSARNLVDSMSDIVWSIDPRRDDLQHVVSRVRQYAADVLEAQSIAWQFTAPEDLSTIKLGPDQRRHLYLILKEAINNIAKHSQCRTATIVLQVQGNQLSVEVHDDGNGFILADNGKALAPTRGGNGLKNLQSRAQELGGTLHLDSAPGQGTRLTMKVPL